MFRELRGWKIRLHGKSQAPHTCFVFCTGECMQSREMLVGSCLWGTDRLVRRCANISSWTCVETTWLCLLAEETMDHSMVFKRLGRAIWGGAVDWRTGRSFGRESGNRHGKMHVVFVDNYLDINEGMGVGLGECKAQPGRPLCGGLGVVKLGLGRGTVMCR